MSVKTKESKKPKWWKPSIKQSMYSCVCCGISAELLPLNTKLYFASSGGWTITKNNNHFFSDDREIDFKEYLDLKYVEELIGDDDKSEYLANFCTPLRSAVYQRHSKNHWVLIESGEGWTGC
jgi:hypothetical protein